MERHRVLAAIARDLAGAGSTDALLKLIAARARDLSHADSIVYLRDERGELTPHAATATGPSPAGRQGLAEACARRRQLTVTEDAQASDLHAQATRAAACPLGAGDQLLGVLLLERASEAPAFSGEDLATLESFAVHATVALLSVRASVEAQAGRREARTVMALGKVLSRPEPIHAIMRLVVREVGRALNADTVGAYFLDPAKEALLPVAGYHLPKGLVDRFRQMRLVLDRWPGFREAMRARCVLSSSDARSDVRFDREALAQVPACSLLFAPTLARGDAVGAILLVWWQTGREFSASEIRLLEATAVQIGLAFENADLAQHTERKLKETETLLSVTRALSTTLDVQTLLRHFLRRIATLVDADGVGSYMLQDGEWLVPLQGYRLPPDRLEALRRLRLSIVRHPFYAEGAQTKRPVFSRDAAQDPRIPDVMREAAPHKSELFVPIVAKGQVIGGVIAAWWDRTRDFSESELTLIEAIATQAGAALENARLFQENTRQLRELAALHELSRVVTGELDRTTLIAAVQAQVERAFDVRTLAILLREEPGQELELALRMVDGTRDTSPTRGYPPDRIGLLSVILETGRPLRTDDYVAECRRRGVEPLPIPARLPHWLGVPMATAEAILGVLVLASADRPFRAADERLLANIAQLAALALHSARLFEERTRAHSELAAAHEQLVRTEKLRALGEMASGVAHDFNNLLAAILGRAQLLIRRAQDPKAREWLEVIEQSARDGANTVRRLQEFTRTRRDRTLTGVDFNTIVRDALKITEARWREEPRSRGIDIEVRTALAPQAPVAGDGGELREVLTNLILNALDAMPEGGVLALATAAGDDIVEVTVSDSGTGMSDDVKKRIFEPFFTTKGPRGTGLGLSMTYGIVSRHGGQISVESREGRGSTFKLVFPRLTAGAKDAEPAVPPEPALPMEIRCLVVDDESAVGQMLGDILESFGHRTTVLTDATDAIARVQAEPFDVVITDLAMPGMSGWDVARAVKAAAPGVAVVLMTGFGMEITARQRRENGIDDVLVKPMEFGAIQTVLGRIATRAVRR